MESEIGAATQKTVTRKIMPLFFTMYVIAYIDRQNVSFAKLQMAHDLGLSEAAYGLGASLFFIGYFLFEAPSNLVLVKVGARLWFARIMLTWGCVTMLLGFTRDATMFYVLRFLLGAVEAGFFPGVLYVLTLWYPQAARSRMVGSFMVGSSLANAIGALFGGLLLDLHGVLGLRGWQWVFLATGAPAILMAPYVLWRLPRGPEAAAWLAPAQKAWLSDRLAQERRLSGATEHTNPWRAMLDRRVLLLGGLFFGIPLGAYGLSYWLPTVVRGFGAPNGVNGLLNVIPALTMGLGLYGYPRLLPGADARGWHIAAPVLIAAACLILSVGAPGFPAKFVLLCLASACVGASQPIFWTLPPRFLRGAAAAAGIAAINSIGNLGGFVAQSAVPLIHDATGSNLAPMFLLAAFLLITAILALIVVPRLTREA